MASFYGMDFGNKCREEKKQKQSNKTFPKLKIIYGEQDETEVRCKTNMRKSGKAWVHLSHGVQINTINKHFKQWWMIR